MTDVCKDCERRPVSEPHSEFCAECLRSIDAMVRGWWEDDVSEGLA